MNSLYSAKLVIFSLVQNAINERSEVVFNLKTQLIFKDNSRNMIQQFQVR